MLQDHYLVSNYIINKREPNLDKTARFFLDGEAGMCCWTYHKQLKNYYQSQNGSSIVL